MFYLEVFALPALFVFVMGLLDWRFRPGPWQDWLCDLDWDSHVLAWGALGGVFTNPEIERSLGNRNQELVVATLFCVGVLLVLAIVLLGLMPKRYERQVGWKAIAALLLGGFALAVPWAVAYHAHMS
jgi:hypothetical protein